MLSIAALLLHAAAFSGLEWSWPQAEPAVPPGGAMQVRLIEPVATRRADAPAELPQIPIEAPRPAVTEPAPVPVTAPRVARVAAQPVPAATDARTARATAAAHTAPAAANAPALREVGRFEPARPPAGRDETLEALAAEPPPADRQIALNSVPATAVGTSAQASAADDESVPHYRAKPPPALTLRYEMQRGGLHGTGDLAWRPGAGRYELKFDARVSGLAVLTQLSTGAFDAAGLAPERFTDKRLGRGTTAANFQRAAGKITYSGASGEVALHAGAQDRLSWMIQLAAIVAAEPQRARPGAKVVMQVTGSHGDAGIWSFRCIGPEVVSLRGGNVDAIKFVREPREAYDTTVQVWLAPQQNDLPVRATQKSGPNDDGYELRLIEVVPAP